MKSVDYSGYTIYFFEEKYVDIGKKIIDKNYEAIKIYKNTIRNYVAKIKINDEKFILKSPKSEVVIPQRKLMTLLKKGESVTTLKNISKLESQGIKEFAKIYLAIVKKNLFIKESYILMEYINGDILRNENDLIEAMELVNKIHKKGIYHGDLNASNFIKTGRSIKIIDSQGKTEKIWNFKRWYDFLTLKNDLLVKEINFNVEEHYYLKTKTISFYLAWLLKNFKNLKIIKEIKKKKKELREKGWKI